MKKVSFVMIALTGMIAVSSITAYICSGHRPDAAVAEKGNTEYIVAESETEAETTAESETSGETGSGSSADTNGDLKNRKH